MRELTGRHVLLITVSAFGVIIAVNLTLAWQAVATFPGLEVPNSYVASQGFNDRKAAQEALGWHVQPTYRDGRIDLAFTGRDGAPVRVAELAVLVGRTTTTDHDSFPVFAAMGDVYSAPLVLDRGKWMVKVTARAADGTLFERRAELFVQG